MKLLYTPTSPYVRKVRVLAQELGLDLALTPVQPHEDDPVLLAASPVSKVPVLVADGGEVIQDSRVICDYLDAQAGRSPAPFADRSREALAESVLDAAVVMVMESRRPESERSAAVTDRQANRIGRIVDTFEQVPPAPVQDGIDRMQISIAVSLAYLDFRLPHLDWRQGRPALAAWAEGAFARPSMTATEPPRS